MTSTVLSYMLVFWQWVKSRLSESSQGDIIGISGSNHGGKKKAKTAALSWGAITLQRCQKHPLSRDARSKLTAGTHILQGCKEQRHYWAKSKTLREPKFTWGHSETLLTKTQDEITDGNLEKFLVSSFIIIHWLAIQNGWKSQ